MGCPVRGVIRADFQHPNRGDESSSSNRSPEASGKTLQVYIQVGDSFGMNTISKLIGYPVRGAIRVDFQHPNRGDGSSSSDRSPEATPMPHASGRTPRGGERHGSYHTSWGALCVEFSELTSNIPIGLMGRAAAIARPRPAETLFVTSTFKWEILSV